MKKTTKKWIATVSAVILAILIAVITYGSFYLVDYALTSKPQSHKKNWGKAFAWYPELRPWLDSIRAERARSDTFAIMPDGTRAHAVLIRSTKANGRTAVVVHGYTNNSIDMLHIARIYNKEMHYNIVLPDLHGHGLTGGNDIQMGWKDRIDVLKWIEMAPKTFGISADSMRIVVHDISMGAATTMCVSGEKTQNMYVALWRIADTQVPGMSLSTSCTDATRYRHSHCFTQHLGLQRQNMVGRSRRHRL